MKKVFNILLAALPFVIVFVGSLYSPSDPDLGWHLKYGEHFFKTGQILRDNTFSVMMPDYKWANTSWGTDLITYATYSTAGFLGLTILGALVVTLSFYFFSKAARLSTWDQVFLFPFLLYLLTPINSVSFRGQLLSLMFLGILFYLISLYENSRKVLFLIIPLFLIWANLHGEFLLGIVMFFVWIVVYLVQKLWVSLRSASWRRSNRMEIAAAILWLSANTADRRNDKKEIISLNLIFILSCLATLINPFGINLHFDAIAHVGSPLLKNIAEYLPFPSLSQAWWNQVIVAVLLGTGLVYLFFKEKLSSKLPALFSIILLFILSFSVRRYAWPAYYLILPILKPIPGFFKPDSKKATDISAAVMLTIIFVIILAGKLSLSKYTNFNWNEYCRNEFITCSPKSADYLKEHKLTDNLYSLYGWGGFLIWNYPQIKPTIDGRMHMWRDDNGYSGFEEYYAIEQNRVDIDKSKYKIAYMSPTKPVYNRLVELVDSGKWELAYQDNFSGIFVKK